MTRRIEVAGRLLLVAAFLVFGLVVMRLDRDACFVCIGVICSQVAGVCALAISARRVPPHA